MASISKPQPSPAAVMGDRAGSSRGTITFRTVGLHMRRSLHDAGPHSERPERDALAGVSPQLLEAFETLENIEMQSELK